MVVYLRIVPLSLNITNLSVLGTKAVNVAYTAVYCQCFMPIDVFHNAKNEVVKSAGILAV